MRIFTASSPGGFVSHQTFGSFTKNPVAQSGVAATARTALTAWLNPACTGGHGVGDAGEER